ncbi:MAG: hypothetical protein WA188_07955 [Terriglobales bacterium]
MNSLITGVENFCVPPDQRTAICAAIGASNLAISPISEVVGVRIPSYASVTVTYRFGRTAAP